MNRKVFEQRSFFAAIVAAIAILVLVSQIKAAESRPSAPGDHYETLKYGGIERDFIVHVPAAFDSHRKTPLVIMLHGRGGSAENVERQTGWDKLADRADFLVAYPQALAPFPNLPSNFFVNARRWNYRLDENDNGGSHPDDLGFIAAVIDYLERDCNADPARIYVSGFSNGGGMSWIVGARMAARVAAIAPVSGELPGEQDSKAGYMFPWLEKLTPAAPIPTLFIIGTADPFNPLAGGKDRAPVEATLRGWRRRLGCEGAPRILRDLGGVRALLWEKCEHGEFEYVTVQDQGHVWPGTANPPRSHRFGSATTHLDATSAIWTFFKSYTRSPAGSPAN